MLPRDYVEDWTDITNLPIPAIHNLLDIYHDRNKVLSLKDDDPRLFILLDTAKYEQCYEILECLDN